MKGWKQIQAGWHSDPEYRKSYEEEYPYDMTFPRIRVVHEEGQWVAVEGCTGMFGEGDTKDEAVMDLEHGLSDLRHELALHREVLDPRLRDTLAALEA